MDTLIYIPFSLWGISPFVSKNLYFQYKSPKIKNVEIYNVLDYGLVLRKEIKKADSLPLSYIYSIQFPIDNYSQYGVIFSRYISRFLFSLAYDYNDKFKQGSFSMDYRNLNLSYYEIFKLEQHLRFFYLGYFEIIKLSYQIYNDTNTFYAKFYKSELIYSNLQKEIYLNYGLDRSHFSISGGIYRNFKKNFNYLNYEFFLNLKYLKIYSSLKPFQIFDTIYKYNEHLLKIDYKFLSFSYTYIENLVPIDTMNFSFSYINSFSVSIKTSFLKFTSMRSFGTPIKWILNFSTFYNYKFKKDITITPFVNASYIENDFKKPIEDIFILNSGVSLNLFDGIYLQVSYFSNLFIQSLWNYNSYSIFLRISMED
ncbi:MAG: hypothetical protein N2504_03085 [candidate division WOR-3 bacterium]|nr:hypothetical protein [candidate division WOR-3 bacterium]MCX7947554.1 hypothetical protein [candidate division WOR-3 bacterium]MDW8150440.1 hypothetical protein [candidate division WOR-3 bacterium]